MKRLALTAGLILFFPVLLTILFCEAAFAATVGIGLRIFDVWSAP